MNRINWDVSILHTKDANKLCDICGDPLLDLEKASDGLATYYEVWLSAEGSESGDKLEKKYDCHEGDCNERGKQIVQQIVNDYESKGYKQY